MPAIPDICYANSGMKCADEGLRELADHSAFSFSNPLAMISV